MKVLVPVEDMLFASAIANFLGQHEWPADTEFRILHVIDPQFLTHSPLTPLAGFYSSADEQILEAGRSFVREVAGGIERSLPDAHVFYNVAEGHPKDKIIAIAREWAADLIVAGSHGRSGLNRFMLGSVSLMLSNEAPCPVLLIKPDADTLSTWNKLPSEMSMASMTKAVSQAYNEKRSTKILIAADETDISAEVIDFVIKHQWMQPAHFKILTVVRKPSWPGLMHMAGLDDVYKEQMLTCRSFVRTLALRLRDCYHSQHIEEELVEGDPKQAVVEAAKQWGADLIIVGSHDKNPLEKLLVGSVALSALCAAPCSVLLLKQRRQNAAQDKHVAELQLVE